MPTPNSDADVDASMHADPETGPDSEAPPRGSRDGAALVTSGAVTTPGEFSYREQAALVDAYRDHALYNSLGVVTIGTAPNHVTDAGVDADHDHGGEEYEYEYETDTRHTAVESFRVTHVLEHEATCRHAPPRECTHSLAAVPGVNYVVTPAPGKCVPGEERSQIGFEAFPSKRDLQLVAQLLGIPFMDVLEHESVTRSAVDVVGDVVAGVIPSEMWDSDAMIMMDDGVEGTVTVADRSFTHPDDRDGATGEKRVIRELPPIDDVLEGIDWELHPAITSPTASE